MEDSGKAKNRGKAAFSKMLSALEKKKKGLPGVVTYVQGGRQNDLLLLQARGGHEWLGFARAYDMPRPRAIDIAIDQYRVSSDSIATRYCMLGQTTSELHGSGFLKSPSHRLLLCKIDLMLFNAKHLQSFDEQ